MRFLCPLIFLLLTTFSPAEAERIAVLDLRPIGADPTLALAVSENLRTMISQLNRFTVVERTQLDTILDEQRLEQTGITEDSQARKIGALANVDLILLGSLSRMFDSHTINARVIEVQSGEVRMAIKVDMPSHADFPRKIDELALGIGGASAPRAESIPPDLEGTYEVQGDDYVGEIHIQKAREIYLMTWEIDNAKTGDDPQTFNGWGLYHDGVLSAFYRGIEDPDNYGISAYEVLLGGKQLRGLYTNLGTPKVYGKVRFENGVKKS